MTTDTAAPATGTGQYADVNGVHLYYERHGTGRPMILLHGGLGSGEMFAPILPLLADHHEVILPDLQGHGRTADIDRPIDHRLMADDMADLIDQLSLDRPDIVGYSLGGGVAFFTALQYPEKIGKLVMISANIKRSAIPADMLAQQEQVTRRGRGVHEGHAHVPGLRPCRAATAGLPACCSTRSAQLMAPDFDYSEEVRSLKVPTMIVAGDADMAPPSHYVEAFKLLDGGLRDGGWMGEGRPKGGHALAILPRLQHYNMATSPLLAAAVLDFLDAQ